MSKVSSFSGQCKDFLEACKFQVVGKVSSVLRHKPHFWDLFKRRKKSCLPDSLTLKLAIMIGFK